MQRNRTECCQIEYKVRKNNSSSVTIILAYVLTLSNPIFPPPAYSTALIYFGRERVWWVTCNYPTVLKERNRNGKSTTCAICWLKSVLH
jgi:hypothetical protein